MMDIDGIEETLNEAFHLCVDDLNNGHKKQLRDSGMSEATIRRLASYRSILPVSIYLAQQVSFYVESQSQPQTTKYSDAYHALIKAATEVVNSPLTEYEIVLLERRALKQRAKALELTGGIGKNLHGDTIVWDKTDP